MEPSSSVVTEGVIDGEAIRESQVMRWIASALNNPRPSISALPLPPRKNEKSVWALLTGPSASVAAHVHERVSQPMFPGRLAVASPEPWQQVSADWPARPAEILGQLPFGSAALVVEAQVTGVGLFG